MFVAAAMKPVAYRDPWTADLDTRIAALTARRRHIAYFYEATDTSTFRYRVFNMVKALEAMPDGETSASWFVNHDLPHMSRFVDRADALVICRARYTPGLDRLVSRARARGIPVIFDIDDFVFDPLHARLIMETLDQDAASEMALDTWFAMTSRIGTTLRLCDRAIVTNEFLAERMHNCIGKLTIDIIPNYLNREQQGLSKRLYEAKCASNFYSDGKIHLGYFSGTPTHNHDFALIAPALERIFAKNPRVFLRVVGFLGESDLVSRHADRIEFHPLTDFMNLQRLIAEVEINLAPLQDNIFTNCKSELKFFEAAITGTITVATPTFTFRQAIRHEENSFLAASYEWERVLGEAIGLVDTPDCYVEMAKLAYASAEAAYGWDKFGKTVENVIFHDRPEANISRLPKAAPSEPDLV